jgi:glucose dehydrogenase
MYTVVASLLRRFGLLSLGLILTCGACSSEKASQVATASIPAPSSAARPDGMRLGSEWPSYNGGYDASRYSSLSQINTSPP